MHAPYSLKHLLRLTKMALYGQVGEGLQPGVLKEQPVRTLSSAVDDQEVGQMGHRAHTPHKLMVFSPVPLYRG